ncbi:MAG: hypothetical protein JW712_04850 [Dehalococcoidales bacterium]|nr:hypothetical protein [Dehalococcoidales bacterium]
MKRVIDYLYTRNDRLVVPIYECEKELDFTCMGHVTIAKSFGFSSYMAGRIEKIQAAEFATVREAEHYPWDTSFSPEYLETALGNFKDRRNNYDGTLGGGCFGPLTVTSDILGVENCNRMAIKAPEILQEVLSHVTEFIITLAQKEEALGAEFFWIAEPLPSLFSPELFTPLCGQYLKQIFDSTDLPGFLHVCGDTTWHTREMLKTGAQVFSIDWMTDLPGCLALVPEEIVLMGNVAPMMFIEEDEATISAAINTLLEQTKDYKNFILSSGCQIPGKASPEKVQLLFDLANEFPAWTNDEYRTIRSLVAIAKTMSPEDFTSYCNQQSVQIELIQAAVRVNQAEKV